MKFYDRDIVKKVRKGRSSGLSLRELEKRFGIPNSTISRWVRDIKIGDQRYKKAREFEEQEKARFKNLLPQLRVDADMAKVLASVFYWCEGSKYPSSNVLAFSNSDPNLVVLFLSLLRKGFVVDESKFRVHLQLHTTHDLEEVSCYWSKLLGISRKQFYKPTVTEPTGRMKRSGYLGTCTLKYNDVRLLLQLVGLYEACEERWLSGRKQRPAKALSS